MAKKEKRLPATLRALRHRNYQLFFGGQLISLTGTWMQSVAQAWLIYRLTNSAVLLGFVGFASQIPVFLLAPIGGAVADKYNRHRILVATQAVSMLLAFALAALTLTGRIEEWHIFVLAAMLGIVNAFNIPAQSAFVVDMVGRDDLVNAIAAPALKSIPPLIMIIVIPSAAMETMTDCVKISLKFPPVRK